MIGCKLLKILNVAWIMRIPTPPAAFGDSLPESVSYSDIPQLDGENCMTEDENPPELHIDNADLLDLGLSGKDMEKIDEYLCILQKYLKRKKRTHR